MLGLIRHRVSIPSEAAYNSLAYVVVLRYAKLLLVYLLTAFASAVLGKMVFVSRPVQVAEVV